MRRSLLVLALLCLSACPAVEAGGVSEKPDCPAPKVIIRGPCPDPCAPCPACNLKCAEAKDCPDCICPPPNVTGFHRPDTRPFEEICPPEHVPFPSSLPPPGRWSLPLTLLYIPRVSGHIEWIQQRDPSLDATVDARWGIGPGIAYTGPSGFGVGVSALYLSSVDASVAWDLKPNYPPVRNLDSTWRGSRWAFAGTFVIPLGGK